MNDYTTLEATRREQEIQMNHENIDPEAIDLDEVDLTPARSVTVQGQNTASQAQIDFINKLKAEKDLTGGDIKRSLEIGREQWRVGLFGKHQASLLIDRLKAAPQLTTPAVTAGRYALDFGPDHEGVNQIRFYRVDAPTQGRWAGRVFVKRYESDETVRISRGEEADVLRRITADPEAAMARYGQEIGRCGRCGRTLTNDESRALGIGPECRAKL